jgi:hypothetical protein
MCVGVEAWSSWRGGSRSKGGGCAGTPWTPDFEVKRVAATYLQRKREDTDRLNTIALLAYSVPSSHSLSI